MRRLTLMLTLGLAACGSSAPPPTAMPILLFTGTGTSAIDVRAIEDILRARQFEYEKADSTTLDQMDAATLRSYRLIIFTGSNVEEIGRSLRPATSARIAAAVRAGTNYLGICAGGFFAGASPYNGLNLTDGVIFKVYAPQHPVRKSAEHISAMYEAPMDHYWEGGPDLTGWGKAVADYIDGSAAVTEGRVGNGWVVLAGTHPEAPESWRGDLHFRTRASESQDYAARLLDYALHGRSLTIREPSPPIEPGPIADASRSYRKQGDYASLVTLSNNLREGMSFKQVTALLGDDFYAPTDGQYYFGSDRDEWVDEAQRNCGSGLVLEFRDTSRELLGGLQSWGVGPICE